MSVNVVNLLASSPSLFTWYLSWLSSTRLRPQASVLSGVWKWKVRILSSRPADSKWFSSIRNSPSIIDIYNLAPNRHVMRTMGWMWRKFVELTRLALFSSYPGLIGYQIIIIIITVIIIIVEKWALRWQRQWWMNVWCSSPSFFSRPSHDGRGHSCM